jgi:uncharacterized DUF497 family protein
MEFEWDDDKAELNQRKHRVTFEEAQSVFDDRNSIARFDPVHSKLEDRWAVVGVSNKLRVLVVSYTRRGETIRLITARKADRREQQAYEKANA